MGSGGVTVSTCGGLGTCASAGLSLATSLQHQPAVWGSGAQSCPWSWLRLCPTSTAVHVTPAQSRFLAILPQFHLGMSVQATQPPDGTKQKSVSKAAGCHCVHVKRHNSNIVMLLKTKNKDQATRRDVKHSRSSSDTPCVHTIPSGGPSERAWLPHHLTSEPRPGLRATSWDLCAKSHAEREGGQSVCLPAGGPDRIRAGSLFQRAS